LRVDLQSKSPAGTSLGCLALFFTEGALRAPAGLEPAFQGTVRAVAGLKEFTGKCGQLTTVQTGNARVPRLLFAGLGKAADVTPERVRRIAGAAGKQLRGMSLTRAGVLPPEGIKTVSAEGLGEALAEGLHLGAYTFEVYQHPNGNEKQRLERVTVFDPKRAVTAKGIAAGNVRAQSATLARDLGNHPANTMTPARLADEAKRMAKKRRLTVRVLDKAQMQRLGMGLLLGVAQGSRQPPKLIVLEYKARKARGTLAFVGKGITFDSGGCYGRHRADEARRERRGADSHLRKPARRRGGEAGGHPEVLRRFACGGIEYRR
jgi:leucyl aminopeptidase